MTFRESQQSYVCLFFAKQSKHCQAKGIFPMGKVLLRASFCWLRRMMVSDFYVELIDIIDFCVGVTMLLL